MNRLLPQNLFLPPSASLFWVGGNNRSCEIVGPIPLFAQVGLNNIDGKGNALQIAISARYLLIISQVVVFDVCSKIRKKVGKLILIQTQ